MQFTRKTVLEHLKRVDPAAVHGRRHGRLRRKRQFIAGVNVTWSMDQHDKWRKFGLFLHVGLDICSGYVLWLKIWWNNRNPNLICSYYLNAIEHTGGDC
jgi:hypothetical protein